MRWNDVVEMRHRARTGLAGARSPTRAHISIPRNQSAKSPLLAPRPMDAAAVADLIGRVRANMQKHRDNAAAILRAHSRNRKTGP